MNNINSLKRALNRHNHRVDRQSKPAVRLSKVQKNVLKTISQYLTDHPIFKASNRSVGEQLHINRNYVGQTINKLSQKQLIKINGKTTQRKIVMTKAGKQVAKQLQSVSHQEPKPHAAKASKPAPQTKVVKPKYDYQDIVKKWRKMSRPQQKIFRIIVSDTISSDDTDHYLTKLSNGDLARQAKVSRAYVSSAIHRLKVVGFIKTSGFTESRVIFLAPDGYKLAHTSRMNAKKYRQQASQLPKLQAKVFRFITKRMKRPKAGQYQLTHLSNKTIASQLKLKYTSTTATLAKLRKEHLIRNSGKGAKRMMILTPKGRQLAKHVNPNENPARRPLSSIMIGTNRIQLSDLVPLNVHSPIYPYELIFKRSDEESANNPFINGNDEVTLKGSKFYELLNHYTAVKFFHDRAQPNILALKPCQANRSDPAVVKLIKHNHRVVIWSYMLVQAFNQNAQKGRSKHLYIPGKKIGQMIVFNAANVKVYFK